MTPSRPEAFIDSLRKLAAAENRSALADLRHGVADATASRAWPHIAPFCDLRNKNNLPAFAVVGAGFADHRETSANAGNFGNTLRRIAIERKDNGGDALESFAARFRRLLTCNTAAELCTHLPSILRAAARRGIPVNYELLLQDLLNWNAGSDDIKLRWAEAYWGGPTEARQAQEGHEE